MIVAPAVDTEPVSCPLLAARRAEEVVVDVGVEKREQEARVNK